MSCLTPVSCNARRRTPGFTRILTHLTGLPLGIAAALLTASTGLAASAMQTTAGITEVFDRPATSSLPIGTRFFTLKSEDIATTLPVKPIVADVTSVTLSPVTVAEPATPATPAVTPLANEQATSATEAARPAVRSEVSNLPVKVDKSSTAAQEQQLGKFERQNRIGEAFLLACELLKDNPGAEFAYDAAIRTSLVLQLKQDVERFYQDAIRVSPLPGKYYVQFAHYYLRQGMTEAAQKLVSDYVKTATASPEFHVTSTRLYEVSEDDSSALRTSEAAPPSFPVLMLNARAAQLLDQLELSRRAGARALQADLASWQARTLLLQMIASGVDSPDLVIGLLQKSLANETNYSKALRLCDSVINSMRQRHATGVLRKYLVTMEQGTSLTDVQAFFAARVADSAQMTSDALTVAARPHLGNTPLIAYERARLYALSGDTTSAVAGLNNLLQEQPTDTFLRMELARVHALAGAGQDVLQDLTGIQLRKLASADRTDYINLITSATAQSNEPRRIADLWLELSPQVTFAELMQMGDIVTQFVSNAQAARRLGGQLADDAATPNGWRLYALLARLDAMQSDHQAELDAYQDFLKHDPENVPMLRFVAELALQNSSLPLQLDVPSSGPEIQLRASSAGGTDLARDMFQRLILLQPRVSDNYSGLMRVYQFRGEVESAKRVAMEFADRGSSTSEACLAAGGILEENGLYSDALVFFRQAVKQDQENFNAWMRYAGALRKAGKLPEAEAIYKRILEEGLHGVPFNQPALVAALLALAHDTQTVPALIQYIDGLRQRDLPGKQEFYLTAAKLFMQTAQMQRAEACLNEFYSLYPDSKLQPEAQLLLGQLQYMRKDYQLARGTFQAVSDRFTSAPAAITAAYNVGEILRQMGKTKEAVDAWEQMANRYGNSDKAIGALYEAALAAYVEMRDAPRATSLLERFLDSGVEDAELVGKARDALERIRHGKPITDYNAG
jgi:tetratricopeptide (TPR) repeat protein